MDEFIKSGTMGLKTNPKQVRDEYGRKEKELHQIIGEQALEIKILKKKYRVTGAGRERVLKLQELLRAEGEIVSLREICRQAGISRSAFYRRERM